MVAKRPTFGLWTLVALVVGNAVGAGIYTTSGYSLADLGSREWVMLAWFTAGLIALCGALSYGMLVRGISESGGEYLYLSRSIHPVAGYVAGWISLLAGFPGAIAFAATALESYLRSSFSLDWLAVDIIAVTVTIAAGVIHIVRVRAGTRVHEMFVLLMLLILTVIAVIAAAMMFDGEAVQVPAMPALGTFSLFAFANSLVWISLSYSGFNAAAYVAGEVRDAKTSVPRGMLIGTFITMLLCLLVNGIILYSAPAGELTGRPDVAVVAANALAGSAGEWTMQIVISLSLLTSITAMVLAGPRVYAKMAEDGALPAVFRARDGQPPRASIALQVTTACLLILIADLRELLSYLGLTLSLCLALAVMSLFVRHWRGIDVPDSIFYPWAPVIFAFFTVLFAILSALFDPIQFLAALPTVLAGVFAYWISKAWRKKI